MSRSDTLDSAAGVVGDGLKPSLKWALTEPVRQAQDLERQLPPSEWLARAFRNRSPSLLTALLVVAGTGGAWAAEAGPEGTAFFESKVRPILVQRCYECHSHEKKIKGGLVLDSRSGWEKGGETGPALIPGKPDESLLIEAIRHEDKDLAMPPKKKLSDEEIATLTEWVQMGAPDPRTTAIKRTASLEEGRKHWAFQPIGHPQPPISAFPDKSAAPIDAFVFAALQQNGIQPAPLADRATLLRRAAFDLTGLPPTFAETAEFLQDSRPDVAAFSAVLDRLLASPAYGEKWARHWLDVAHYADTTGCSSDWPIDDLWRYRDWVVDAFNGDKPFDRFLTEQLAGDLLAADMLRGKAPFDENAYREHLIGTGFLATAKRFGSDPGAYDHLTIGDTLDTTWKALQGLGIGCARCHDHKFDPISAKDYYALYGIFASSLYPYAGAEKNQNAALLAPLDAPAKATPAIDGWNRTLPSPGAEPKPRSVLAISDDRWGFEDNETSEDVSDRPPMNPWLCRGGVAVRGGNSTFTQLLPLGIKCVDFQATAAAGEMTRRVRWEDPSSAIREVSVDFRFTDLWNGETDRLELVWRSVVNPETEIVLSTFTFPERPTAIVKMCWHRLQLSAAPDGGTVNARFWNESGKLIGESSLPVPAGLDLRADGDLTIRCKTPTVTNRRKATVRIDNIVASSSILPIPVPFTAVPVASGPVTAPTPEEAAQEKQRAQAAREEVYKAVVPQKPETAFAMWEGTPHDVPVQKRGEPASPSAIVPRRNLEVLGGELVQDGQRESGRRDLARWLLEESNPLTLRVFVNRVWQWHFGRGIVATPNDFGHKGEAPTHPELLDYLVRQFRENGLSLKALHRQIMLSYAYRQSSTPVAGQQERDPDNRWVARFSPRRLTAEEVRDSMLAVSGLLERDGRGYQQPFPPIQQRNWSQHHPFSMDYESGYARYDHRRRSLYLPVVRLVADPFLSTFDGADSNQSVAARGETAVPLQALALLNAPPVVDAANTLAAQALNQTGDGEAIRFLHRHIFGSEPTESIGARLTTHLARMTAERGLTRQEAPAVVAQSLLASNAFLHVF